MLHITDIDDNTFSMHGDVIGIDGLRVLSKIDVQAMSSEPVFNEQEGRITIYSIETGQTFAIGMPVEEINLDGTVYTTAQDFVVEFNNTIGAAVHWDKLAPSDLTLTVLSDSSIKLDWTVNSANRGGTKIERSTDGVSFTEVGSVAGATFTDTGLTDGIRYYYRVRNYKGGSNSAYTTIANTYTWLIATLTATGDGTGVSTLRMEVSETQTFTLDGAARFYTNLAATTGESTTWEVTAGALRTIYLKCPSGTANLTIPKPDKVIKWGNRPTAGWVSSTNAAKITIEVGKLALTELRILGTSTLIGALPTGLTYLRLFGTSINWTYSDALPTGLTYLALGDNSINWTGLDVGNNGNIGIFDLINYRISKMTSTDMVTLLTQLTNRTGSLPSTITINDYADYASPPTTVTNAVAALKAAKSITTINLGA